MFGLLVLWSQGVGGQELGPALLAVGALGEGGLEGGAAVGRVEQDFGEWAPVGIDLVEV